MAQGGPSYDSLLASKTFTWDGSSGLGLNGSAATVFTVTGGIVCIDEISGRVTTNHTASNVLASMSLGVTGVPALFIPLTIVLNVTGMLAATPIWASTTPTAGGLLKPAITQNTLIAASILITFGGTGNVTGGVLETNVRWHAMTPGAVLAAT